MTALTTSPVRVVVVSGQHGDERLASTLAADRDIAVLRQCPVGPGTATEIGALTPDVVVATAGPGLVGLVEAVMGSAPKPILIVRSGADGAGRAELDAGAVDVFDLADGPISPDTAAALRRRVHLLRKVVVVRHRPRGEVRTGGDAVVGVAASTGGPRALATVIGGLVGLGAPILVVQHIHPDFVAGLVRWLGQTTGADVALAREGDTLQAGAVYVAPADRHLHVRPDRRLTLATEPVSMHRPSADELFSSLATSIGSSAIGVLLTGMGEDGASGLLGIRRKGGVTIAQDEASSAIFGMPRAAQDLGAVSLMAPLEQIAPAVRRAVARCR